MRVVELMNRRCRLVLEWATAVTVLVTVSHCILQSITPSSPLQPSKKLQENEKRDLGGGQRLKPLVAVTGEMEILAEREKKKNWRSVALLPSV